MRKRNSCICETFWIGLENLSVVSLIMKIYKQIILSQSCYWIKSIIEEKIENLKE